MLENIFSFHINTLYVMKILQDKQYKGNKWTSKKLYAYLKTKPQRDSYKLEYLAHKIVF